MDDFTVQLAQLLGQITSPKSPEDIKNASQRLQSEFYLNPQCAVSLIHIMQKHEDSGIKQLAGIEARKQIPIYWEENDQAVRNEIKNSLLQSTLAEQVALVRHTSARVVAAIGEIELGLQTWNELPQSLNTAISSGDARDREVATYIIYILLEVGAETFVANASDILPLVSVNMSQNDAELQVTSMLCAGMISELIDSSDGNAELFKKQVVPQMVEVLKGAMQRDDAKTLQLFEVFSTLLLIEGALVADHIGDLVQFMLEIAKRGDSDESKMAALRFLISAVRFKKRRLQALGLGPALTNSMVEIIAQQIAEFPEEQDDDDEDEDTTRKLALRVIGYLSNELPPKQVLVPIFELLQQQPSSDAVLSALSYAIEGSPEFVATHLDPVLESVIGTLRQNPTNVAALMVLVRLAYHLHHIVGEHHATLVPLICSAMDASSSPAQFKAATSALESVLETLEQEVIADKYLAELMPRLITMLEQAQDDSLRTTLIAAVGSAAFAAKEAFTPYAEQCINGLGQLINLENAADMTEVELAVKGSAFDTIGAIAGAIGKEAFRPYVNTFAEKAYATLQVDLLREAGFVFFGVIAKLYGEEFGQYLPRVIPLLVKFLDQDDFGFDDEDEDEDDAIGQEDDDSKFKVNSLLATQKETAFQVLGDMILATKGQFLNFLEEITDPLFTALDHFYEGIRKEALGAVWKIFHSLYNMANLPQWKPGFPADTSAYPESLSTFLQLARTKTVELLEEEDSRLVVIAICEVLVEAMKAAGPAILGDEDTLRTICAQVILVLKKEHPAQMEEEEIDAAELEQSEYDSLMLDYAFDVCAAMSESLEAHFVPIFKALFPFVQNYANSKMDEERAFGIGALAEMTVGMKSSVSEFTGDILNICIKGLTDPHLDVRSNSAFAFGVLAENSTVDLTSQYPAILQKLQRLLTKVDKQAKKNLSDDPEDNNDRCLANACGCVARMTLKAPGSVPISEVVPALVSRLPLGDGQEEYVPIFGLFAALLEHNDSTIVPLKGDISNLIQEIARKDESEKVLDDQVKQKLEAVMQKM